MMPKTLLDGLAFPECPRWHDGALYFSDMHAGVLWRLTPDGRSTQLLELAAFPGGLGWLPDGTLQVVSMLDRRLLRLTPQGLVTVADLSPFASHPINDMVIDRQGRAYIGQFGFDLNQGEAPRPTALLSVEANGGVRIAADDLLFPNGMVITPDGSTLILAETLGARLTAFDIQPDGKLANRRTFAALEGLFPDGICLDRDGAVWVACPAGARRIVRVSSQGAIVDNIPLPGRDSFACMLGGPERCDLYICTAQGYQPEETRKSRAGKIEVIRVAVAGAGLP
jgi:sugar lactone lactonase YvrE